MAAPCGRETVISICHRGLGSAWTPIRRSSRVSASTTDNCPETGNARHAAACRDGSAAAASLLQSSAAIFASSPTRAFA